MKEFVDVDIRVRYGETDQMGVAYLAGLILYYGLQRRWVKV